MLPINKLGIIMKNYTIKVEGDISVIRFLETLSIDELSITQPQLRLWDLSNGMNLSEIEIQKIAEYGKLKFTSPARVAILAPADLTFGLSRMHEVYKEQAILEERIFRNENDAFEWLRNKIA